jgi:peptidoglycan hydrolase-like protein with peptidoglycan-binding domain
MTTTVQTNKPILQFGAEGSAVRELQTLICNFYRAPVLNIDGIFGNQTLKTVQEIQDRFFLTVDGVVGSKTWNVLINRKNAELPVLRVGSQGDLVRRVQQRLAINGYSLGAIDGAFGAKTEAAVKRYQADFHLTVDGVIGEKTWMQLSRASLFGR